MPYLISNYVPQVHKREACVGVVVWDLHGDKSQTNGTVSRLRPSRGGAGYHSIYDTMPISVPLSEWYFFDTRCFKKQFENNKNTSQLQPKTLILRFAVHSNQDFLQITFVVFSSFAATALAQMLYFNLP